VYQKDFDFQGGAAEHAAMSDAAPTSPFHRSIAVVIGIDQYAHGIPPLRTAVNDARRVGELLAAHHGYEVVALLDGDASRARLVALLKQDLPQQVGPDDRVCLYFAGHGVAIDGHDGPNGYLLPADASRGDESSFLDMPLVHDAILALPCRHMLVILDSCFSGAFRWSGTRAVSALPEVIHRERYERFVRDPAWQVITSAAQDQEALDQLRSGTLGARDGSGEHSPFALALFEALEGQGDIVPRAGGDGLITATELYLYIEDRLENATIEAGRRQTPRLWPLAKHEKGEFAFVVPGRALSLPPAPPLTTDANPWRGLSSYDRGDAALFFGRDAPAAALQAAIEATPLVVVLGASGTGKSSLVKAGVLPRLESDSRWLVLPVVRPGTSPLEALAACVATLAPGSTVAAPGIDAVVATWCQEHPGQRLLLVVDQCEELVTMARAASAHAAVTALLAQLLDAHPLQLTVVLTLRTDFEPQFDRSALSAAWAQGRFVVPPMSRADLKAIIEQPASARVLYFEPPGLVESLLDDVVNTPGGLPLLSFALSEMFGRYVSRQASDRALTKADYDAIGGVVGALRARADAEHDALDDAHRAAMQRLMLRMVSGGAGSLVKRRVSDAELEFADAAEGHRVHGVLRRLTDARLLVEGKDTDGEGYAEPAHDALVRGWGRLIGWLHDVNADAVPLATRQKLAVAALEWARVGDGTARRGLLWSDSARSAMLAPLVRHRAPWLNAPELAFATASVRRRRNTRWATAAVTVAIAALGLVSAIFGVQARRSAAEAQVQEQAAREAAARAEDEGARAEAEATRAGLEKQRAVRSLFSSLRLFMSNGNAGSVCVYPGCVDAPPGDGDDEAWFSIGRLPDEVPNLWAPDGHESRDFIVARDYGAGHVLVYAQDGLTRDDEVRGHGADNLTFAENAVRWLDGGSAREGCAAPTTIVFWPGTFLPLGQMTAVQRFVDRRGWRFVVTNPAALDADLACASVLWYASDWDPPSEFATRHVPRIERFVAAGGGLLVGGLGWSYAQQGPDVPYAADQLGEPFGFKFSLNAFQANARQPIPLFVP
jgi:hypothetical protein